MKHFFERLKEKRDWLIYCWTYPTVTRVVRNSPGVAYIAYLTAKDYSERNPPTEAVRDSAERFFESMKNLDGTLHLEK